MYRKTNLIVSIIVILCILAACAPTDTSSTSTSVSIKTVPADTPTEAIPALLEVGPTRTAEAIPSEETGLDALTTWHTQSPQTPGPNHYQSGQRINLDSVYMTTINDGWGISGANILVTSDGGQTWSDVTPYAGEYDTVYGGFGDSQHAWIVFSEANQIDNNLTIYRTIDGGKTWEFYDRPPVDSGIAGDQTWVEFVVLNNNDLWIMPRSVVAGAGIHYNHELFKTTDGGQSLINLNAETSDDYTGWGFVSPDVGIRTIQTLGAYEAAPPAFDITYDGGTTWTNLELPPPAGNPNLFSEFPYCETYQPVFLSPQSVRMLVGCFDEYMPPKTTSSFLYTSLDGGSSWETTALPQNLDVPNDKLFFFDPLHALLLGKNFYKSDDGGLTWTLIKKVVWDGQFSFNDSQNGWAVAKANGEVALLKTTTGGATWKEIKPTIK